MSVAFYYFFICRIYFTKILFSNHYELKIEWGSSSSSSSSSSSISSSSNWILMSCQLHSHFRTDRIYTSFLVELLFKLFFPLEPCNTSSKVGSTEIKIIGDKIGGILCVRVKMNKRSFQPFCV